MIQVQLPKEMYLRYLAHREEDLKSLKASIEARSPQAFQKIGHQLMGNARSFGFDELEKIGVKLEKIRKEEVATLGPELLREFSDWIESTKHNLQTR
jgi:HPt (histidine-containing phosphotransfer) domain-containing protein